MKLIIAGGRDYIFGQKETEWLNRLSTRIVITSVLSGCTSGADTCGEMWAKLSGIPVHRAPADWKTHGRAAGPIRNQAMADYADALALFPGGRGSADMKKRALAGGLQVFEYNAQP